MSQTQCYEPYNALLDAIKEEWQPTAHVMQQPTTEWCMTTTHDPATGWPRTHNPSSTCLNARLTLHDSQQQDKVQPMTHEPILLSFWMQVTIQLNDDMNLEIYWRKIGWEICFFNFRDLLIKIKLGVLDELREFTYPFNSGYIELMAWISKLILDIGYNYKK